MVPDREDVVYECQGGLETRPYAGATNYNT